MKIFGITGNKNTGKTHLIERVIEEIISRGLSVSTIKHAHHDTDIDSPGRDSYRHRTAGAKQVALSTKNRLAIMTELDNSIEISLQDIISAMDPVDIVLIEGYKTSKHPKIETHRSISKKPLLAMTNNTIQAVMSDCPLLAIKVPVFDLNNTLEITNFILNKVGLYKN